MYYQGILLDYLVGSYDIFIFLYQGYYLRENVYKLFFKKYYCLELQRGRVGVVLDCLGMEVIYFRVFGKIKYF